MPSAIVPSAPSDQRPPAVDSRRPSFDISRSGSTTGSSIRHHRWLTTRRTTATHGGPWRRSQGRLDCCVGRGPAVAPTRASQGTEAPERLLHSSPRMPRRAALSERATLRYEGMPSSMFVAAFVSCLSTERTGGGGGGSRLKWLTPTPCHGPLQRGWGVGGCHNGQEAQQVGPSALFSGKLCV